MVWSPGAKVSDRSRSAHTCRRNNVDPSQVVLGLGWYGRAFSLKDPSCSKPWCHFSEGAKKGECTGESGILSNAGMYSSLRRRRCLTIGIEIFRIIKKNKLNPSMDRTAAVKWVTWDSNQWVSYDDGETMQMKIAFANQRASYSPT